MSFIAKMANRICAIGAWMHSCVVLVYAHLFVCRQIHEAEKCAHMCIDSLLYDVVPFAMPYDHSQ